MGHRLQLVGQGGAVTREAGPVAGGSSAAGSSVPGVATTTSQASPGAITIMFGMARRKAMSSQAWCVGPSPA